MASLADIRTGLRANLVAAGYADVNLYVQTSPALPCFEIDLDPEGVDYDLAMKRGLHRLPMVVRAVHAQGLDLSTQTTLDGYIDGALATDVKTALETDRTLAGAAQDLRVTKVTPRRYKSETTGDLLVCLEWSVDVWATGTS